MKNRILIITNTMNMGGAETFIMKLYRKLDRNKWQFDFLINNHSEKNTYDDEIREMGGKIYGGYSKLKHPLKNYINIKTIVNDNKYKYVLRLAEHPIVYFDMLAAKHGGSNHLIARSTNTQAGGLLGYILAFIFRPLLNAITDIKLAPSTEAGEWLFGKYQVKKGGVIILHNGIDFNEYRYSDDNRIQTRQDLGITDEFVIGHVGRFNKQKNHQFLLRVFQVLQEKCKNIKLILIGTGELEQQIRKQTEELRIKKDVVFAGQRKDVNCLYSAMDLFVFPSLYEGLPNAVVEAQATGVPCIISDTITKEVILSEKTIQLPIDEPLRWVEIIEKMIDSGNTRNNNLTIDDKYNIDNVLTDFLSAIQAH